MQCYEFNDGCGITFGIIAQNEATSTVWGMPGAVAKAGICSAVLPLNEIAFMEKLKNIVNNKSSLVSHMTNAKKLYDVNFNEF